MKKPTIIWDWGTAYDFFSSLRVLHEPGHYGLRPAWAAGVRSRVPVEYRMILEQVQAFVFIPRKWLFTLPKPKDGASVLWFLGALSPEDRLLTLVEGSGAPEPVVDVLRNVSTRGSWKLQDQEALRDAYQPDKMSPRPKIMTLMLDLFAQAAISGEQYLAALKAYQRVFFAEEEEHIRPFLENAVSEAVKLADLLPFESLIEALSRGVRLGDEQGYKEWVFIPSFWISPLVSFDRLTDDRAIFMFAGRPSDVSLVPGDVVPEGMLRIFKTLGDPTRLRILRYLSQENIPPAEIARRLRLRVPTVTHHLNVLRLAGLVYLTLEEKNDRRYAARIDAIDDVFANLKDFLVERQEDNEQV
jgi:DNA-binding transcriptional ArsR family regulator